MHAIRLLPLTREGRSREAHEPDAEGSWLNNAGAFSY
jgi:hypothetical protein